jgi:hypothetical protein
MHGLLVRPRFTLMTSVLTNRQRRLRRLSPLANCAQRAKACRLICCRHAPFPPPRSSDLLRLLAINALRSFGDSAGLRGRAALGYIVQILSRYFHHSFACVL